MIEIFVRVIDKEVQNLEEAFKAKEISVINNICHKIKPSVDQMGVKTIADEIRFLEKYENDNAVEFTASYHKVQKVLKEVCKDLREELE